MRGAVHAAFGVGDRLVVRPRGIALLVPGGKIGAVLKPDIGDRVAPGLKRLARRKGAGGRDAVEKAGGGAGLAGIDAADIPEARDGDKIAGLAKIDAIARRAAARIGFGHALLLFAQRLEGRNVAFAHARDRQPGLFEPNSEGLRAVDDRGRGAPLGLGPQAIGERFGVAHAMRRRNPRGYRRRSTPPFGRIRQ